MRQVFDIALVERDVGAIVAEALHMPVEGALGDVKLLGGHVDAMHEAVGADELAHQVDVASGTAAQVDDGGAGEGLGDGKAATVEAIKNIGVHVLEPLKDARRGLAGGAAGVGLEIGALGQHLAVVVLHPVMHVVGVHRWAFHGVVDRAPQLGGFSRRMQADPAVS